VTGTLCPETEALIAELEHIPARSNAALQVLSLADDPDVGAADLAKTVTNDPALTTRIMRVANSAYYGLSGRVSSAAFAITVLGFDTVRAIAAAAAAGLEFDRHTPEDFLNQAASTAVSASIVAPRVGARRPEAYSVGLLHNLGIWLLNKVEPARYRDVVRRATISGTAVHVVERETYGADGAAIAASVLKAWRFPDHFTEAIAEQHNPVEASRGPLGKALKSGLALTAVARGLVAQPELDFEIMAGLKLGFIEDDYASLLDKVREDSDALRMSLAGF
jgi:HD-like signal output (HDOD) protein